MSSTIEQIKSRLSITEVVGGYITLEKSGANMKAKCPFHNEKTPSFFVSPERNSYYCFGCGAKGDIFTFVQEFESLDFSGALKVLADRAGVPLTDYKNKAIPGEKEEFGKLLQITEEATTFFQKNLKDSNEALLYLKKRGLKIETVRDWRIGFAPDEWRLLKSSLLNKGYLESDLKTAGLIKSGEQGSYDRFRGRIMFPIFDSSGRPIAFSGRILKDSPDEAKYLNSPETPLFTKSKVLYGLNKAKSSIKEKGFAILVEGQMDLLMSHQAGLTNTVASSGTALTSDQISTIRRFTDTLLIAYDSDNAGQNASFKAWQTALGTGIHVKAILLPDGYDPAQAILENVAIWNEAISESKHIVDYYINIIRTLSEKESDVIIKDKILPLIRSIESPIDQARFISKLSFETKINENAIWEELSKIELQKEEGEKVSKNIPIKSNNLRRVLSYIILQESKNHEGIIDFKRKLKEIIPDLDIDKATKTSEKEILAFEAEAYFGGDPRPEIEKEILYNLDDEVLKERFSEAMHSLRIAENEKDALRAEGLAKSLQEISKQISTLSNKYLNN